MTFLVTFIGYVIKFVLFVAVAGCGIFLGKKLRDYKDAKSAAK